MPAVLLILPTGTYRAEEYLAAAEHLGVQIVIASEMPQAMAAAMGDHFLEVPLDDPPLAARLIVSHTRRSRLPIAAVIAVDDPGLLTAALAAAQLEIAHNTPEAVSLTRDKGAMRAAFEAAGVPQPAFEIVPGGDPAAVAGASERLGLPVVVKPVSLSGSRGVIRANSPIEASRAAEWIRRILVDADEPPYSPLLVECFVPGPEVAVEGICQGGEPAIITVFDKPDPLDGPYFEETLYISPSRLPPESLEAVNEATRDAVKALGLAEGPFHAELRVPGALRPSDPGLGTVKVLEVAARTIGGRCSKAMMLEDGSSLEELVIARAIGAPSPPPRLAGPCGILMIPIPRSGTLEAVDGLEDVRAVGGITGVEITIPLGRHVRALPEGDRYLGFVFAAGTTHASVEQSLRAAKSLLRVRIRPDRPGPGTVT